jgi:hypothetical protein
MPAPKDAPQIGAGDPSKDGQSAISQKDPLNELDQTGDGGRSLHGPSCPPELSDQVTAVLKAGNCSTGWCAPRLSGQVAWLR